MACGSCLRRGAVLVKSCRSNGITSISTTCALRWPGHESLGFLEKPRTDEARLLLEGADRIVGVPWVCPSPSFKKMRLETLEAGFERAMAAANVEAQENAHVCT